MTKTINLCEDKYTLKVEESGAAVCLRYGEPWRDLTGDHLIGALIAEVEETREAYANLVSESNALRQKVIEQAQDIRDLLALREKNTNLEAEIGRANQECEFWRTKAMVHQTLHHAAQKQTPVATQHRVPNVDSSGIVVGYSGWKEGKGLSGWPQRELYAYPLTPQQDPALPFLRNLVGALDSAYISSWQSTHRWQDQLDAARNYVERIDSPDCE